MKRLCGWILLSMPALIRCVVLSASDGQGSDVDGILKLDVT